MSTVFSISNGAVIATRTTSSGAVLTYFYDSQYHTDLTYDATANTVSATVSDYTGVVQTSWSSPITFNNNGVAQSVTPTNGVATVNVDPNVAGEITVSTTVGGIRNGSITFVPNTLKTAQAAQIAQLEAGLYATLNGGFTAKTLVGTATSPHTYPSNAAAQSNFTGAVTAFTTNPNKTSVTIQTLDAGWLSHTKAEFYGVYSDGDNWKEAQYAQLQSLIAQVQAATTIAAVQAIVWTEATY